MNEYRIYSSAGTRQCKRCLQVVGDNIQLIDENGICAQCHKELFDMNNSLDN